MELSKLTASLIYKVVWLFFLLIVSIFTLLVCEGPDRTYILDSNYRLWNWPGTLIRIKTRYEDDTHNFGVEYICPLGSASEVNAFALFDEFIVGRTTDNDWFALNRKTYKVWYPYKSQQKLRLDAGVEFSNSDLRTSRPWNLMIVHLRTKIILPLIALFFIIALVGFKRTGRILKFPFKGVLRTTTPF